MSKILTNGNIGSRPIQIGVCLLGLIAFSISASAQTKFLGPAQPEAPRFSARYGIPYFANGFETAIKGKWKQARSRGASKTIQGQIRYWGKDTGDRFIGEAIDTAWEQARQHFLVCGGERARIVRGLTPRIVQNVTVRDTIWEYPGLGYVAGLTFPNGRVEVLNIYFSTNGRDFREYRSLLRWEFINVISNHLGLPGALEGRYQDDGCIQ